MTGSPASNRILTINGGSSSIKFALFETSPRLERALAGEIQRIGSSDAVLQIEDPIRPDASKRPVAASGYDEAVALLLDTISERFGTEGLSAVGHRVVHGGPKYYEARTITPELVAELERLSPFDPMHLPGEIRLIRAFQQRFPGLPQVACFDTAFHHDLPRAAQLLPLPRRYEAAGVRRYGFHGLSYSYLMGELARRGGPNAARGAVILAHLGNGASLAAVRDGRPIDTSMGFTPAAGIPMSTRSGDLDPGLVGYLARTEGMDAERFNEMVNLHSGLLGVSETSSNMQALLQIENEDVRAAEAIALFCYQVKKCIGAFAAALGGLQTLVFSGGIGANAPPIRQRICDGLTFLGLNLEQARNAADECVISTAKSGVTVWVIPTDEERVIAEAVQQTLDRDATERQ